MQPDDSIGEPQRSGYSRLQITLHWLIVGLIGLQLLMNDDMQQSFDARMNGRDNMTQFWAVLHIGTGITVFVLGGLRLIIRLTRGVPPPPADNPALVTWAGIVNHLALYMMIFAMPLTGAVAWFGYNDIASELHELGGLLLMALVGLHVLGALAEHFVFRQNTLMRMFRPEKDQQSGATAPETSR